jgi:predicted MFS family arabinose efflux permease
VSNFLQKFLSARAVKSDIDYRVLVPLLVHAAVIQTIYAIVRVTTSYRAIELHLPVVWLGLISASFAVLPILLAVRVGRWLDRGHDAHAAWIGSALFVLACVGFFFFANTLTALLLLTALFGVGQLLLMASQQMLCVRCAGLRSRDSAFGAYLVAAGIGQGLGPYLVAWLGGTAAVAATGRLFAVALAFSILSLIASAAIRPARKHTLPAKNREVIPVRTLLSQRGLIAALVASVITISSVDLLTIYLPLWGAEHNVDARQVGALLTIRAIAALFSRASYARVVRVIARGPLTLISMGAAAIAYSTFSLPIPLSSIYAAMVFLGLALGIATTLSLTNVVDLAHAAAVGTVMSIRITGNRIGQMLFPFAASIVAAAAGVGGIFIIVAAGLAASGTAVQMRYVRR